MFIARRHASRLLVVPAIVGTGEKGRRGEGGGGGPGRAGPGQARPGQVARPGGRADKIHDARVRDARSRSGAAKVDAEPLKVV